MSKDRLERRSYRKSPGRQYGYEYDPLHSDSMRSYSSDETLLSRPDPRRTRQLLRQNILAKKVRLDDEPIWESEQTDTVPWHRDRPALMDELGRKSFAVALARRIRSIQGEEQETGPFILHIHGSWGSGKSSLLNFLSAELKHTGKKRSRKNASSWIIVNFNAWTHQRLGTSWWWLMNALFQQSAQQLWTMDRWSSIKLRMYQFTWRFLKAGWSPYLLALLALAAMCWLIRLNAFFGLLNFGSNQVALGASTISLKPLAAISQSASTIIALLLTVWGFMFGLSRALMQGSARTAAILMESSQDPMNVDAPLGIYFWNGLLRP